MLSYATKLEDALDAVERTNDGKLAVLATLTEKFRLKFYDLNEEAIVSRIKCFSLDFIVNHNFYLNIYGMHLGAIAMLLW